MTSPFRTPEGGRIDRATTVEFTFDGQSYTGHPGDTLASALLAHGRHQIATSIKLGRPRGIAAAWAEDPGGLVQIEEPFPEPMLLASTVELSDGLVAHGVPGQGRLADVPDSARYDAVHHHAASFAFLGDVNIAEPKTWRDTDREGFILTWTEAENRIFAQLAGEEAAALEVDPGVACLGLERRTWRAGETITHVRQIFPAQGFNLVARFSSAGG